MAKYKAYAKSIGDRNSYILMEVGTPPIVGHTEKEPPLPIDGFRVTWNDELDNGSGDWEQVEVPNYGVGHEDRV